MSNCVYDSNYAKDSTNNESLILGEVINEPSSHKKVR